MMKKVLAIICLLSFGFTRAQDSLVKKFKHEVGFNTVLLIKQLISNNANSATSTLPQLPYQLIYTMHYKDLYGFRLGVGFTSTESESIITGQPKPKVTTTSSGAYRAGLNYNFVRYGKITSNCFLDGIYERNSLKTITSTTVPAGPFGGTAENVVETQEVTSGSGISIGLGLKYSFNKHISVYTEIPVQMKNLYTSAKESDTTAGIENFTTSTSANERTVRIILPTTIFLTISF
jgi:hypothetical protein